MTQEALSAASGVSQTTISRLEKVGGNPTRATIVALGNALGVDPLSLVFVADDPAFPVQATKSPESLGHSRRHDERLRGAGIRKKVTELLKRWGAR